MKVAVQLSPRRSVATCALRDCPSRRPPRFAPHLVKAALSLLLAGAQAAIAQPVSIDREIDAVLAAVRGARVADELAAARDLERVSAVLMLRIDPPDARVLIDGREQRGVVRRPAPAPDLTAAAAGPSSEVWIEGIQPGSFDLEVVRSGFRSYRATVHPSRWQDVELPAVALERQQAAIGLVGLPEGAVVTANGRPLDVNREATPPYAPVVPGEYDLVISRGTDGYFETSVLARDRRRVDVDVELRPALAFLGVLGSAPALIESVRASLDPLLEQGTWVVLDRAEEGVDLLREAGVGAGGSPDWAAFRERLEAVAPAALYLAVVLDDGPEDGAARLWWSASPGPARPDVRKVAIRSGGLDPDAVARLAGALAPAPVQRAPVTGVTVIESLTSAGLVVGDVDAGSPAAVAGLDAGMEISSLRTSSGVEFESWQAAIAALEPGDVLEVLVGTEGGTAVLHVIEPDWGWRLLDPYNPGLLPTAAAAHLVQRLRQPEGEVPSWLLELELASVLLARGDLEQAVSTLRTIEAPRRGGLSQDSVRYLTALALAELADKGRPDYAEQAVAAFRDLEYAERSRLGGDHGPSVAARARLRAKTSLALVPPAGAAVVGTFRAEVLVGGTDIAAVRFLVDGKVRTTQARERPWAMLRLARYPTQQLVRVEGLNAVGEVVASDELLLNEQRGDLRVQIEEPPEGIGVVGPVEARASIVVPEDRRVAGVEFRVGDQVQAVLQRPPWQTEIAVPTAKDEGELIWLAVTATLDDGSSVEDVRTLTASALGERMEVDLVELYMTVVDRANRPVIGLRESDFTVFEDGNRQALENFVLVEDLPLVVGVAIDTSESMGDVLDEAKRAAGQFLTGVLKPSDSCFVVAFDSRPHLLAGRTSDVRDAVDQLRGLRATGRTALHDALMTGLYYFRGIRGRRALVLLSDGEDNSSTATWEDVLEYARHSEIVVYTIGLGFDRTETVLRRKLEEIASETGGRAFFIDAARELRPVYQQIERELRSQYLLVYASNQESVGEAFRRVEVQVAAGRRARTLSGYYP